MACCHRRNAILANLHPSGWRSRAPSLIDFLLRRKKGQERWSFVKNPWCFHARPSPVCKTARLSSLHRHPCLVPVFRSLLVSGPESNIPLNVQRNLLYFFCHFCFGSSPPDVAPAQQSAAQTMRACLFILQFPAFHSSLEWSNQRNSLKELSAWLLSERGKQIQLFLTMEVFHKPLKSAPSSPTVIIKDHPQFLLVTPIAWADLCCPKIKGRLCNYSKNSLGFFAYLCATCIAPAFLGKFWMLKQIRLIDYY